MALNLARLFKITGNRLYNQKLLSYFQHLLVSLKRTPRSGGSFTGVGFHVELPVELVVVGDSQAKKSRFHTSNQPSISTLQNLAI